MLRRLHTRLLRQATVTPYVCSYILSYLPVLPAVILIVSFSYGNACQK